MLRTDVGIAIPVFMQLKDRVAGKGVRAQIRDQSSVLVATIPLTHAYEGLYTGSFTPASAGFYVIHGVVYTDGTYATVDPNYETLTELLRAEIPVADQVWDAPIDDHQDPGSTGEALKNINATIDPQQVADAVWEAHLHNYPVPDSAGYLLFHHILDVTVPNITDAVWDELVATHSIPNSFGEYIQAIHTATYDALDEIRNPVHGLEALRNQAASNLSSALAAISVVDQDVLNVFPYIDSLKAYLTGLSNTELIAIAAILPAIAAFRADNTARFDMVDAELATIDSHVLALSNNTTVRFVVPERLILPTTGSKSYQFHLRLFDDLGNPEAPDSTPTIRIRRLDTGTDIVAGVAMTPDGVKIGAYLYDHFVSSGGDQYPALVEATVVENGVTRYIPATTEVTEFEGDLAAIQLKLDEIDNNTVAIDNTLLNPTYGLPALKAGETSIVNEVNQNEALLLQIRAKTDTIPADPATQSHIDDAIAAVYTRPTLSQINTSLANTRDQIMGPDGRSLTDVYDRWDTSGLVQSSDPRLAYLDAPVSSRSTLTAAQVWTYVSRTLTEHDPLSTADLSAIWSFLLADINTAGSIGKRIKDYLDVAVSTRAATSDILLAIAGLAQEATLEALGVELVDTLSTVLAKLNSIQADTDQIQTKTGNLPSDPASESALEALINACCAILTDAVAKINAIKAKTDNLPVDPARQSSVLQIPTNPVLETDPRLTNLDAKISTRSTLALADLATLAKSVEIAALETTLTADHLAILNDVAGVLAAVTSVLSKVNPLPADPAAESTIAAAEAAILAAIAAIGTPDPGATAQEVWEYPTRTLTDLDLSNVATKDDIAAIPSGVQYVNKMSTTYQDQTGEQEVIVWAEKNGVRQVGSNCIIQVKDAVGAVKWTASSTVPNADGVFRFINPVVVQNDRNFYIVISIEVDGTPRVNQRPFFTVG